MLISCGSYRRHSYKGTEVGNSGDRWNDQVVCVLEKNVVVRALEETK